MRRRRSSGRSWKSAGEAPEGAPSRLRLKVGVEEAGGRAEAAVTLSQWIAPLIPDHPPYVPVRALLTQEPERPGEHSPLPLEAEVQVVIEGSGSKPELGDPDRRAPVAAPLHDPAISLHLVAEVVNALGIGVDRDEIELPP